MSKSKSMAVIAATAALAALAVGATTAIAGGIPDPDTMAYSGRLLDSTDSPVAIPTQVQVGLHATNTPGVDPAKCLTKPVKTEAKTGRFSATLGPACLKAVSDNPNLWVEVTVGAAQKTTLPRVKLRAVPYAVEAARASGAAGALKKTLDVLGAATAKLSTLEGKLAKAEARLHVLEKTKPTAASYPLQLSVFGTGKSYPTKITTANKKALLLIQGIGCKPGIIEVLVDGKTVSKATVNSSGTLLLSSVSQLAAGHHSVLLWAKSGNSSDKCPAQLTVLELP